jgi:hypothetical protein
MSQTTIAASPPQVLAIESWPKVQVTSDVGDQAVVGVVVGSDGAVPELLGLDREAMRIAGFEGGLGSAWAITTRSRPLYVALGCGDLAQLDVPGLLQVGDALVVARTGPGPVRLDTAMIT